MNVISAIPFTLSSFAAGTKRVLRKACALAVRTKQIVIKVFFWIKEHPMATVSTIFGFTFYLVILATPAGFGSDSLGAGEVVKGAIAAATQSLFERVAAGLLYAMFQSTRAVDWVVGVISEAVTTLENMFVKSSA